MSIKIFKIKTYIKSHTFYVACVDMLSYFWNKSKLIRKYFIQYAIKTGTIPQSTAVVSIFVQKKIINVIL